MKYPGDIPLVTTIKERCRVCYTCVRECPAKAIRIDDGQAEVIAERCIGCGNCVRVCSQRAKRVLDSKEAVRLLLASGEPTAAILAPSFPAEFYDVPYQRVVGMVRALGFKWVNEVAFGADLVARRYARLVEEQPNRRFISTSCPAVVAYVERYHPDLVPQLAPVVSPMIAIARVMRRLRGGNLKVVFIGPCIAKKGEAASKPVEGEVDAVLTFVELREMLAEDGITPQTVQESEFDRPFGWLGGLFPISRGMLQAARLHENVLEDDVVACDGTKFFAEAIREFESGDLDARLLEVLSCTGCIMGAGVTHTVPLFRRRAAVRNFVRESLSRIAAEKWEEEAERFSDLDLSRMYMRNDQRITVPYPEEIAQIMERMGKFSAEDELNCGACGYETCKEHAIAIHKGLAESEMCLPHTIEQLRRAVKELAVSNEELAAAQEALMQSEKLASMGQIAAGVAHELNNPLGVVLMYAHLLLEECAKDSAQHEDARMIAEQADRCKKIVAGLLHFARQNKVVLQPTDLRALVERTLDTLRIPENISVEVVHELNEPVAEVDGDQIIQVLVNLLTNAVAAMPDGGVLAIRTGGDAEKVWLVVSDTGVGIPKENLGKIFEPFFTTKQIGKGTGLGLAVTYGIVKMHCGDIRVQSNADSSAGPTGSAFTVTLPRKSRQDRIDAAMIGANLVESSSEETGAALEASRETNDAEDK